MRKYGFISIHIQPDHQQHDKKEKHHEPNHHPESAIDQIDPETVPAMSSPEFL